MDSHAPVGGIDRAALLAIERRLKTAQYVGRTHIAPKRERPTLTAWFDRHVLPPAVEEAYYDVRWYTSGDFEIHYQEKCADDSTWCRRWDRHPREGSHDHYHPPPDAGTPEPASYPDAHCEVLRTVDTATIEHLKTHPLYPDE